MTEHFLSGNIRWFERSRVRSRAKIGRRREARLPSRNGCVSSSSAVVAVQVVAAVGLGGRIEEVLLLLVEAAARRIDIVEGIRIVKIAGSRAHVEGVDDFAASSKYVRLSGVS